MGTLGERTAREEDVVGRTEEEDSFAIEGEDQLVREDGGKHTLLRNLKLYTPMRLRGRSMRSLHV